MARHGNDYIPTFSEQQMKIDEAREYMRTHTDPRTEFIATYEIPWFSKEPMVEYVTAMSQNDAIEIVKRNCGLVGWIPVNLKVEVANKTQSK